MFASGGEHGSSKERVALWRQVLKVKVWYVPRGKQGIWNTQDALLWEPTCKPSQPAAVHGAHYTVKLYLCTALVAQTSRLGMSCAALHHTWRT